MTRFLLYRVLAFIFLFPCFLFFILLFLPVVLSSSGSFFFKQKRIGKFEKIFYIYKIRTMHKNSEKVKKNFLKLNEANGPVFKIRNDPRFTNIGKYLARHGLDELPQLINVLKGEMSFVGPRPLPISEVSKIPHKFKQRHSILPGMTSLWVIRGSHAQSFNSWMKSDLEYVSSNSLTLDFKIILNTLRQLFFL